jgi:metallo-beta-lactamase family protein
MKLHFLGANRQVTGSRYCLETAGTHVMIDCGLFQEREFVHRNWDACPIPPAHIKALLLTHAHVDHVALLPKLVREGFKGPVYCTRPTVDLAEMMLRDSAKIQQEDAEYKRRRHQKEGRKGRYPEIPLYTLDDAERALPRLRGVPYGKPHKVTDNLSVTFHDAGHILGSAMLEMVVQENGQARRIVFSGDIGQWHKPIIRDPTLLQAADYVVMESTYGDREHGDHDGVDVQLADVINATLARGGKVIIPTFAVERAQELVYHLGVLVRDRRLQPLPVFLDSPMAVDASEVFRKFPDCFDQETWQRMAAGESPLHFPGLRLARSVEESKAVNAHRGPAVIMAPSGMCNAGRIKHHLRQHIERPENTILFVGFQSQGTLGRQILDGNPEVRIHGRNYRVRAKIAQIFGFSAHADRSGLLRWVGSFQPRPKKVFLCHGEESVSLAFAETLREQLGCETAVPQYQEVVEVG